MKLEDIKRGSAPKETPNKPDESRARAADASGSPVKAFKLAPAIMGFGLLALLFAFVMWIRPTALPLDQEKFCEALNISRKRFKEARSDSNPVSKERTLQELREYRRARLLELPKGMFVGWIGQVDKITVNESDLGLNLKLPCEALTLLEQRSRREKDMENLLSQFKVGDWLLVTGTIFPHEQRGLYEKSLTESGSFDEPEFYVSFADIKRASNKNERLSPDMVEWSTSLAQKHNEIVMGLLSAGTPGAELNAIDGIVLGQKVSLDGWNCGLEGEMDKRLAAIMEYEVCKRQPPGQVLGLDVLGFEVGKSHRKGSRVDQIRVEFGGDRFMAFRSKVTSLLGQPETSKLDGLFEWERAGYRVELFKKQDEPTGSLTLFAL